MQHDERIIHEPPVIPLAACPEHVREPKTLVRAAPIEKIITILTRFARRRIDAQRAPVHLSSCGALLRLCEAICEFCSFCAR